MLRTLAETRAFLRDAAALCIEGRLQSQTIHNKCLLLRGPMTHCNEGNTPQLNTKSVGLRSLTNLSENSFSKECICVEVYRLHTNEEMCASRSFDPAPSLKLRIEIAAAAKLRLCCESLVESSRPRSRGCNRATNPKGRRFSMGTTLMEQG